MLTAQRFFDITPTGRLLNRFGRELMIVDGALPTALQQCAPHLSEASAECVSI